MSSFPEPPPWSSPRRNSVLEKVEEPESEGSSGMNVLLEKQVHLQKDVGAMRMVSINHFGKRTRALLRRILQIETRTRCEDERYEI